MPNTHLLPGLLKPTMLFSITASLTLAVTRLHAHTPIQGGAPQDKEQLRQHILEEYMQSSAATKAKGNASAPLPKKLHRPVTVAASAGGPSWLHTIIMASISPQVMGPAGNGALMAASFAPFKPKVRYNWDGTTFFIEGDNMPDGMPNRMAGITTWQQQVPLPVAYFANTTNPENAAGSLGYKQPNYWRLPLVPTVAATPTLIFTPGSTNNNFQRGAIAIASNGVAIFNPANNTGRVSYEIGELDYYGGHSGMADDYHYHIIPTHLSSRFGGPLSDDKPLAWSLDGYPIYGYVEPDGSARVALDSNGGHDHGAWGYHYHAIGTTTVDATHPYGTPQSPYTMTSFRGTVVNFGGQVDGQPEVSAIRSDGSGGYNAKPITGAYIVAFMNPAPLVADGSGNLGLPSGVNLTGCSTTFNSTTVNCASTSGLTTGMAIVGLGVANNATVTQINSATQFVMSTAALATTSAQSFTAVSLAGASADNYLMRVNMGGVDYDECWKINRSVNPHTLTMTWRAQALISGALSGPVVTTTNTYTPNSNNPAAVNRLSTYVMAGPSQTAIPDTSQTIDTTATFGEDADYTANQQSLTDNGNGTITDNVTGLMWQKVDNGESTWETAVANVATVNTGGYTDWRLPTPSELFSIFNHNNANPALNTAFFPNNPAGTAEYWWTSDIFGASTTQVWCSNAGGGLGPKPKAETISAGGAFRYHTRYVRGKKPTNGHNYQNNGDGTVTDLDTGLMWTQIPGPAVTWDAALGYVQTTLNNNTTPYAGYADWRLPNIKELQTLTDYTLATATGTGAALKPSMNQTMFAKTLTNCTTTAGGTTITCADTTGLIPGMPIVDDSIKDIAGAYIPYVTPPVVGQVTSATTFTVTSGTGIAAGSNLTLKALPPPTAFWTSTSQNNATANAWVVEFGTNNTSSPARNAQGIISQNVKTATYPVFAVRTTSITTQIAVAQGNTALTDGVSTVGYTTSSSKTFTITNTGVTSLTLNGISIDGANADKFTLVSAPATPTTLAAGGSVTFGVLFSGASAGTTYGAALHIASSDAAVGSAFDITLTGNIPVIGQITTNPAVPINTDTPYVTAKITPASGATITQAQLTYTVGNQTTATALRETFSAGSTTSGLAGAINGWTVTSTRNAADVKQRSGTGNNTVPIVLTNCVTNGTTAVTCASTANLWPGMSITGTNIAAGTTISQVNSTTSLTLSTVATGSGTGLSLTAAGMTLTGCSLGTSPTINTASTTGLAVGMGISAASGLTTNPPSPTVASITDATHFNLSSTVTAVPATLTASGCGAEFASGTSVYTDTMFATTNPINASSTVFTAGSTTTNYVEFYVRTSDLVSNNGWQFQVSPDGTAGNYTTRLSETYAGSSAASCTLNSANDTTNGSTTVLCPNTSTLTVGNTVQGTAVSVASCTTSTTTNPTVVLTANTSSLAVGMFVSGTGSAGIPNGARITAINPGVSFTMNVSATAAATSTLAANYFDAGTTISSIVTNTSFVVNKAAFYSGSGITVSTVNHGFKKMHYDFQSGDLTANMKMRFQFSGYNPGGGSVFKSPTCDIDDLAVVLTTGIAPVTVTMLDDGLHGDGAAGDGVYGVQLPAFATGTALSYSISATDSNAQVSTLSNAGSYTTIAPPAIITSPTLPNALTSAPYTQALVATGGSGGFTWSVTAGALPSGLSLGSNGTFSGTATATGNFNFTATATDSSGHTASRVFTLTVSTPPNVVIIITDDQGWGDVGYHTPAGQVQIQTPNMDSFATSGIRLERFYATTVCSVTRSTLATGRNPIRHATNNVRGTDLSEHMMPQTFKAAGYQTYMVGKWHLGGSDKNTNHFTVNGNSVRFIQEGLQYAPFNRGWDSHYGQYSGAIDYYTHRSAETDSLDIPDWWLNGVQQDGPSEHTDSQGHGGWSPDLEADKAIYHIQNRNPNQPMLLHVAFNSIHGPVSAPSELITKYANLGVTNTNRRLIAAAVDGMDQAMGRVLNALDTAGISNNTIVVWFGDNGGDETKGSLNDPLRGDKGDSYEGGLREPAGIRWPGVLPAGVISNQHIWVGDMFPTLCAATGVTSQNPKPMDGLNMWPALLAASNSTTVSRGAPLVTDQAAPIAIYQYTDPVNGGTKDFKLRRGRVANVLTPELFNLTDDPYETTDLIANPAYASIVTSLTSAVTAISPEDYKPYIGPPMISNSVAQGVTITLYAPFTSYKAPTVQWRKNGANVSGGVFTQIVDSASAAVNGSYAATLTLTNVSPTDAGTYDVVITNSAGNTTSDSGVLTVSFAAPTLNAMATYTKGTSATVTWPAVSGATSYTIQRAATSDFASVLSSQIVSTTTATFTALTNGTQYFYRATATDGTSTSPFSNTVSSTQDAGTPVVTITAPVNNTITSVSTVNVQGTASDAISPVTGVVVNGVTATTSDAYAHWSATVPLLPGANTISVTANDSADAGGNSGTASITVTLNATGPTITSVSTGPTAPTYLDPTYVIAAVTPASGTTISQVQLLYDTATPVSTAIWREVFNNTSSNNWNGTGAINSWTTVGAGNVRQAISTSNHTVPVTLTSCATNGTTTVTCASTVGLWPGMLVTGPTIAGSITGATVGNTTVASITNGTTFVLSQAATGTGTGLTLTAAGVTLTNCVVTGPTPGPATVNVTCDSTAGLINGMTLTGTGMANNATVASVTSATTFTMNAVATASGTVTLTATGAAAEFNGGTANLTDSMFTTTNAINTSGTAGYVEFWVQTRDLFATNNCGWTMQVSPDNGTTWNTRQFEDWNSETVSLSNVVLNSTGTVAGSTTVTCASTSGLTTGRSVLSTSVNVTIGMTSGQSTATCTNTTGLVEGMFITATGIPNNTRVGTITPNTSFTLVTGTTATLVNATATNAAAAAAATYFAGNATVSSITNGTTFVLNTAAYATTSAAPIATAFATTVNHAAQLFHYDFVGAELGTQTKIRFQATGYAAAAPTRTPRISIDDIVIATTAPPPTVTLAMFDDGNHGDGAADDGVWGAAIPAQTGGKTVNFRVVATDSNAATSTSPSSSNYTYTVNNLLTDATILGAEFLTLPKTDGVTLNLIASVDQNAFVEYGTQPGKYTMATTPTLFTIDNAKPEFKNPIRIPITGLQPDTEYYYRVRHKNTGTTFYSARGERSFHTARPRGTTFSFTVTADPHIDVNTDMQLFWRAMANVSLDNPDIHMDVGDIFMTDKLADGLLGVPPKWGGGVTINQTTINNRAIIFRNAFERACHSIPFFFGLGNHEAEYGYLFNAAADKQNNIPAWDLKARKAFYPAPTPDGFFNGNPIPKDYTGGSLGLLEDYYAFEWGEALFIMLDPFWNTMANPTQSNDAWQWSLGKVQYDWLRDTLKNSSAKYKFVFMHHIVGGSTQAIINGVPTPQVAARGGIEVSDKYEWGGKNADGSAGFATKRPGWDMPIHDLLVLNKVNVVFHGHDHLYGFQTKDGIVYLECPQPGTPNYTSLGSDADGQYVNLGANSTSYLLPNSGHIRVTVGPNNCVADYVRSYRTASDPMPPDASNVFNDETASRHNRDISHSFVLAPRTYAPIEVASVGPGQVGLRWNAIPNKPYQVEWSTDLVNWTTIDTVTFTNTYTNATYTDSLPARVNGQRAFYRLSYTP